MKTKRTATLTATFSLIVAAAIIAGFLFAKVVPDIRATKATNLEVETTNDLAMVAQARLIDLEDKVLSVEDRVPDIDAFFALFPTEVGQTEFTKRITEIASENNSVVMNLTPSGGTIVDLATSTGGEIVLDAGPDVAGPNQASEESGSDVAGPDVAGPGMTGADAPNAAPGPTESHVAAVETSFTIRSSSADKEGSERVRDYYGFMASLEELEPVFVVNDFRIEADGLKITGVQYIVRDIPPLSESIEGYEEVIRELSVPR